MRNIARNVWRFFAWRAGALPYVIVTAVFVLSRLYYRIHFALTFDWTPITYFIQYIPVWLLKHDFWRSLLYVHQQAPFQNLFAGGIWVTLGPERGAVVLDAIYVTLGYTFAMCFLASMRRLGVGPVVSTIFVSVYTASPVAVLYELWLFYHQPVVTCFALALLALLRFYERATFRRGLFFFSMLAFVALFRSIYGPLWMIVIAGALLLRPPREPARPAPIKKYAGWRRWLFTPSTRRTLLLAALGPTLIVGADVARTPILMGRSFGSGMAWANIPLKIWPYVGSLERERLQSNHLVSEAPNHEAFGEVSGYPVFRTPHQTTGVPLLDMDVTPDGQANLHAIEYLAMIDKYYEPDGKYLLRHETGAYIDSVLDGFRDWYCSSPTRDMVLYRSHNVTHLTKLLDPIEGKDSRSANIRLLQIGLPLSFLYGIYRLVRARARAESERSATAALLFMLLTIGYTSVGTMLISYGDFSRYRFEVDPFYWTLFAWAVTDLRRGFVRAVRTTLRFARAKIRRHSPEEVQPA